MTTPARILVVEDEQDIADVLLDYLRHAGYAPEHAADGRTALQVLTAPQPPDLTLLDVMLPGIDGLEVLRQARRHTDNPIVVITARVEEVDRLIGLELGADDYMAKPFSPRELVARVRARLRRHEGGETQRRGRFEVDAVAHRIRYAGHWLDMTRYEHALLHELLRRPGAILSRAQLLDRAWEDALESGERTVDTHVKTLRAKLRALDPARDPIRTHRGLGYSIDVD